MRTLKHLTSSNGWVYSKTMGTRFGGIFLTDHVNVTIRKLGLLHQTLPKQVMTPSDHSSNRLLSDFSVPSLDHVLDLKDWD